MEALAEMQNPDSFADGVHHFILLKALEAGRGYDFQSRLDRWKEEM